MRPQAPARMAPIFQRADVTLTLKESESCSQCVKGRIWERTVLVHVKGPGPPVGVHLPLNPGTPEPFILITAGTPSPKRRKVQRCNAHV